jgi:hypothetical protein
MIEAHESEFDIPRRSNADPLAVLSVRYGLPVAKAG